MRERRAAVGRASDGRRGAEAAVMEVNARLRHALAEVSEREAEIRQHAERLRLLNEFARSVSGTLDLESVFGIVTRQVPALVGAVRCSVARREPGGVSRLVAVFPRREEEVGGVRQMGVDALVEPVEAAAGALAHAGGVWVVADTAAESEPLLRRLAAHGVRSSAVVVIFTGSEVWGTLNVGFTDVGAATPERVEILEAVAAHLGVVVKNAELYAAVRVAHEELRRTQAQVVQHERLRALGQMASGIAHDFNNSLAPVVGFSELLLDHPEELENGERVREYLRLIHTGAQDAAGVVRRLREFYRPRDTEEALPGVRLPELVEQVVGMTQPRWKDEAQRDGRTVAIELELEPVPPVAGSETELREALTNLIFNAVDALPQGGTITLRTEVTEREVVVAVRDTGIGMDDETRRRCLDPFFTSKGDRGTGLGLAMVWGTVQRHGGTLSIESAPGVGTTVRIGLPPAAAERPGASGGAGRPRDTAPGARYRVLVVDDDDGARRVAAAMLEAEGHTVEVTASGREALERLARGGMDVVLTDRAMPEMRGDQLAAAAKRLDTRIRVLMMTGFGDMMNSVGERPPAVDAVLGKPISRLALLDALEKVSGALLLL